MAPRILLRWVSDDGVLRREWVECRLGYIGRLSSTDMHMAEGVEARYEVFLRCLDPEQLIPLGVRDSSVSRRHLLFRVEGRAVYFIDSGDGRRCKGSSNGTLVNGMALKPCVEHRAPSTGALALGGLVIDYRVGGVEPGVLLVSTVRGLEDRVAPPSWRLFHTVWLPRVAPQGARRMSLVLALTEEPRGSPLDYEERGAMFALVASAAGDGLAAERALYAACTASLRLRGVHPSLDAIRDAAEAILRRLRALRAVA